MAQAQGRAKESSFRIFQGLPIRIWGSDIKTTIVGLKEHVSGMLRRSG